MYDGDYLAEIYDAPVEQLAQDAEMFVSGPVSLELATVEQWRATGQEVLESGKQQERLLEALLTFASSEGGISNREPVDLSERRQSACAPPAPRSSAASFASSLRSAPHRCSRTRT
jgi:hypothetical protein